MSTPIEHDFRAAADRIAQAFMRLIEAVTEAEQRLRYSGDTFNDQGCWSRANACWAAADALPAALVPLLFYSPTGAMTAPAPGTPSDQQNKAETVVSKGATGRVSTTPDRPISEMAALEAIRGERKQHAQQFPESGDEELDHGNRMFRAGLSHAFSVVRTLPAFVGPVPFTRPDAGGTA